MIDRRDFLGLTAGVGATLALADEQPRSRHIGAGAKALGNGRRRRVHASAPSRARGITKTNPSESSRRAHTETWRHPEQANAAPIPPDRHIFQGVFVWNVPFARDLTEPAFAARDARAGRDGETSAREAPGMTKETHPPGACAFAALMVGERPTRLLRMS